MAPSERTPLLPSWGEVAEVALGSLSSQDLLLNWGSETLGPFSSQGPAPQRRKNKRGSVFPTESADVEITGASRQFLKTLLDQELDARLSRCNLERVQRKLLNVLDGQPMEGGPNEEIGDIMIYKNRVLFSTRPLHFAIWCSSKLEDAFIVEAALSQLDDEECREKAKYKHTCKDEGWQTENWVDAIHIAAGLGSVPAMLALMRRVTSTPSSFCSTGEYMSTWSQLHTYEEANPSNCWDENYYMPIHEATYLGSHSVVHCLLEHSADAREPNKDGVTALHFLAMRGIAAGLESGKGIRDLVRLLLANGGSLAARIPVDHSEIKWRNQQPLQLAAADDSRFPKSMLFHLVPCLSKGLLLAEPRFFSDISLLTTLNAEATDSVIQKISRRSAKDPGVLRSFRRDAQLPGRSDVMASILFLVPNAGGAMLDMLMVDPEVRNSTMHNIPARTSLWGFWRNLRMRCTYQTDVSTGEDGVRLPTWKYNAHGAQADWHHTLVPMQDKRKLKSLSIYSVSVSTMLLPNLLDIDIMLALARTEDDQIDMFANLSIQGIVYCLWNNLIEPVWCIHLALHLLELGVLIWWGVVDHDPGMTSRDESSFGWAIICAGALRELTQSMCCVCKFFIKRHDHEDEVMQSLWDPIAPFLRNSMVGSVVAVLQLKFAMDMLGTGAANLTHAQGILLALTVLMKVAFAAYIFRLSPGGSRIYAVLGSLVGGATKEMLFFTFTVFASFSFVFMVLSRGSDNGFILASSYRTLLFGDGDSFNNLGLNVDSHEEYHRNNGTLAAFCLCGSFLCNIIILNLIIAVYGDEYNRVSSQTPLLFQRGRAVCCVKLLLSCNILPWRGTCANIFLHCFAAALVMIAIALHHIASDWTMHFLVAILLGVGQVVLLAALIQCDWFSSEGISPDGQDRFLWICHPSNNNDRDGHTDGKEGGQKIGKRFRDLGDQIESRNHSMEGKLDRVLEALAAQSPLAATEGLRSQRLQFFPSNLQNKTEESPSLAAARHRRERLSELKELLEAGSIDEGDFKAQKERILSEI